MRRDDRAGRRAPRSVVAAIVATTALMAALVGLAATTAGATTDIGVEGASYAGAYLDPSGSKPQAKLWHHDGSWWGVLFHSPSQTFRIHRLERGTDVWIDTGTVIDTRVNSRSDALWDGNKLYVASQRYSVSSGSGYPARLYRLTYDAANRRFLHDAGFPTQINNVKSESLVIDKDATGTLWATWTQSNRIYVNHTVGGDATWATPFVLPGPGTTLSSDDISSVVAFDGRVGVLWGNQQADAFYFAFHRDGAPPAEWETEVALAGSGMADDHLSARVDATGRVYAVVKTEKHGDDDPLIVLLRREVGSGAWTATTVSRNVDSHTRPIVQLDEAAGQVHVVMTGPQPPSTTGQKGGDIYWKSSPMDVLAFAPGLGTPIIRDAGNATMNNATSTKQAVSAATGLVVLAGTEDTDRYWHADLPLGGGASTTTSEAPSTTVEPTTTSSTSTTSTSTSTTVAPTTTTTSSTSTTAAPTTTTTSTSTTEAPTTTTTSTTSPAAGRTTVLGATRDAYVRSAAPTTRYGLSSFVRVQAGSTSDTYQAYLAFDLPADLGAIQSAKLRLYVIGGSVQGGTVHRTDPVWDERSITWSTAPALAPDVLADAGRVGDGTWIEIDVTGSVTAGSAAGFGLRNTTSDGAYYSSREGANPPQLVITST